MLLSTTLVKKITNPPSDPHIMKKQLFAHYRCEIITQLLRNDWIYSEIIGLIDIGATS